MEGIQVSVEKVGPQSDISIIRVGGYIDTTTSSELERALDTLLKSGVFRIIIDLGNVDYISSAGWGIFISEIKGIRERGGDLKLARMIPDVYEVFELLEFHYILKAFDTIEEANQAFDKERGIVTLEKNQEVDKKLAEVTNRIAEEENENFSDLKDVEDKIRAIAIENPSFNASQISKELKKEKYGFLSVGSFTIWKTLRKLNLGTKKLRKNFDRNTN